MKSSPKIYFASDLHLGLPDYLQSRNRENLFVQWLDSIKHDATEIYLVGDIFDFWWEYKKVVPRGFTRFLGKISELSDAGIKIYFFTGNHDVWVFDYLEKECGVSICREPVTREWGGKKFYIAHGDGLGPGDYGFKILKKIFTSKILQWMFARLHPNFALWLAHSWSNSRRNSELLPPEPFLGEDKEYLILHARNMLHKEHFDYLIYGHRHIPMVIKLNEKSSYVNLGDWLMNYTYAVFENGKLELKSFINHKPDWF